MRFALSFLTLSCIPAARKPVNRADFGGIFWLGVLWLAFPMSMFPHAEQHVSSALSGMLTTGVPLIATIVAAVRVRALPSRRILVGLAIGITGGILMALPEAGAGESSALGVALICVAIVSYGVAINLAQPLQQRNGALPVVWRAVGVAAVLTAPLGVPPLFSAHWTVPSFAAVVALGVLGTALANVLSAAAAGRFGPTQAAATSFVSPVVALALGIAVRREHVAMIALFGVALCLIGSVVVRSRPRPD